MKFRPLGDRVVVRRIKEDQKTAGGIIIPDTVAKKPQEGEVVAVGRGGRKKNGKRGANGQGGRPRAVTANGPAPK